MRPHDAPLAVRVAVAAVVVVAFVAGAGVATTQGHQRTQLPVQVTGVAVAATNTTEGYTFVKALRITVTNHGDHRLSLSAFVWSGRQHDYTYWQTGDPSGRVVIPATGTVTVTLHAPHKSEWLTPGYTVAISLLTANGGQRTTVTYPLPANTTGVSA